MTFTLDVTGGTAGYYYALRSGTLPPGVSLSPTGSLGGAPRAEGTFHFTLQAMDSASASAIREFSLTVGPPLPLQITSSATCPDGTLGFPYHHPLLATGGLAPYNWSVTAGALPDGVALSNDGKLWGRPTAAGTFNFTARVVDSLGVSESKDFTLIVRSSPAVLQFSAAGFSVNENDGTATITVSRSGSSTGAVGVTCFTRNVTASQGADYIATWGTLAWADGDAADKIFTVPIRNNMLKQPNRALEVVLKSPTGSARLGNPFQAPLTIVDDDTPPAPPGAGGNEPPAPPGGSGSDGSPPPEGMPPSDDALAGLMALPTENTPVAELRFSAASYTVSETATNAVITVTRLGNTAYPVGVDFATVGGSAAPDADYTVTAGTLAFDPGETSKTFRVPVLRNAMAEPEETIEVVIANPVGPATLGRPSAAVVRIADPDTRQQPDNLIRVIGERFYVGNNRYNATALGQSRSQSLRLGETRAFEIRVQNDGNVADTFLVRGDGGGDGFGARYFTGVAGGADITADVVSGACLVRDLPPGAFHVIRVELTAGAAARPGSSRSCFVTSVCVADETRQDTVKAVVNLKRR
jgi:predicted pyridoxine 5'-phosphate oxidase superfamily flavin-nucleotide-binding protein